MFFGSINQNTHAFTNWFIPYIRYIRKEFNLVAIIRIHSISENNNKKTSKAISYGRNINGTI